MADQQQPSDPLTVLVQAATVVHEMFLAYVAAGFTEDQAMSMIAKLLAENSS